MTDSLTRLPGLLQRLPDEPRVVVSGNFATPYTVLAELDRLLPTYRLWAINGQPGLPDREGVVLESSFVGPGMRGRDRLRYVPCRLSLLPNLLRTVQPPDVVLVHVAPPRGGFVSLGTEVNVLPAAIETVRARGGLVIAQVNPKMPFTYGDALIPESHFDLLVEADEELASPNHVEPDEASLAIATAIGGRVTDGATLQAGIGAVPDSVLRQLTDRRGLRIWTEMFSDSVLALEQAGALAEDQLVTSFVFGSPELYSWLDGNQRVLMLRTEKTNDPALIAHHDSMVSVNTALQVDLFAQANASRTPKGIFSGFGGQTDFIVGAMHSRGGQALLGLRSWHPKANVSTIVPRIPAAVTSFQATAIITEQGSADIFGRDQERQAANLIENAAHPDAREELWREAAKLNLVSRRAK